MVYYMKAPPYGSIAWKRLQSHYNNSIITIKKIIVTTTEKYELFTLDATDISNKYIELVGTINDNQSIRVFIDNVGIKAEQGVDYSVSANQIFWTAYSLATLLEVGDKLKIFYI